MQSYHDCALLSFVSPDTPGFEVSSCRANGITNSRVLASFAVGRTVKILAIVSEPNLQDGSGEPASQGHSSTVAGLGYGVEVTSDGSIGRFEFALCALGKQTVNHLHG